MDRSLLKSQRTLTRLTLARVGASTVVILALAACPPPLVGDGPQPDPEPGVGDGDGDGDADGDADGGALGDGGTDGSDGGANIVLPPIDCTEAPAVDCGGEILAGDINVFNQDDLDALSGVRCLEGDLIINQTSLIDLSPLTDLERVDGDLQIVRNTQLADMTGLNSLREVTGLFNVLDNDAMTSFDGLGRLTWVGDLNIVGHANLVDISDLEGLNLIDGYLRVRFNTLLLNLVGLGCVTDINLEVTIENNASLEALDGLEQLERVGTDFEVLENVSLIDTSALDALNEIGYASSPASPAVIAIEENDALVVMGGFNAITNVDGEVSIFQNPNLETLNAFSALTFTPNFTLERNYALTDVDALQALEFVPLTFSIRFNAALENLDGLASVHTIGNLTLDENDSLTSSAGLSALDTIYGNVIINENDLLDDVDALQNVTDVPGDLDIKWQDNLGDLSGLANLESAFNLGIRFNGGMNDFVLPALTVVHDSMIIRENVGVTTFSAPVLTSVGQGANSTSALLSIGINDDLISFDMNALTAVGGNFSVFENLFLSSFSVDSLEFIGGGAIVVESCFLDPDAGGQIMGDVGTIEGGYCVENTFSYCEMINDTNLGSSGACNPTDD